MLYSARNLLLAVGTCLTPVAFGQAKIEAILNAATFIGPSLPRGGALATLYVSGLIAQPGLYVADSIPLPFELDGVSVEIDGFAFAPVLAVSVPQSGNAQINFQVPLERNASLPSATPSSPGSISVLLNSTVVATQTPLPPPGDGGGFFVDQNRNMVAQHASDFSPVTLSNPARAGEEIIAYASDLFGVWPPPPIGLPAPLTPLITADAYYSLHPPAGVLYLQCCLLAKCQPPIPLKTDFLGLAPGEIGVEQVNFVLPQNVPCGQIYYNDLAGNSILVGLPVQ